MSNHTKLLGRQLSVPSDFTPTPQIQKSLFSSCFLLHQLNKTHQIPSVSISCYSLSFHTLVRIWIFLGTQVGSQIGQVCFTLLVIRDPCSPHPGNSGSNVWGSMSSFKMKLCFILVFIFLDSAGHLIASTELKNLECYCLSEQALGKSWITVDWKMDEDTLCQESESWLKVTENNHCIFLLDIYLGDYKMRWKYRCI